MHSYDKQLIKISMIGFLICFILLFYLDSKFELETREIKDLSIKDINNYIQIKGKVISQNILNNNTFLKIKDNSGQIKAIIFKNNLELDKSINYLIIGKVSIYNQKLELIIDDIKVQIHE